MLTNYAKRILSFALVLIMVLGTLPAQAFATEEASHEGHDHDHVTVAESEQVVQLRGMADAFVEKYEITPDMPDSVLWDVYYNMDDDRAFEALIDMEDMVFLAEELTEDELTHLAKETNPQLVVRFYVVMQKALNPGVSTYGNTKNCTPVSGITVTSESDFDWTDGVISASAAGDEGCASSGIAASYGTVELKVNNIYSKPVEVSFDVNLKAGNVSGGVSVSNGKATVTIGGNQSVTITVTSAEQKKDSKADVELTNFSAKAEVTFGAVEGVGSYTLSVNNGEAQTITTTAATRKDSVGTSYTLTAVEDPNTEYTFKGWYDAEGNIVGSKATYTFSNEGEWAIYPVFVLPRISMVFVAADEGGSYTVDGEAPGEADKAEGEGYALVATPAEGYYFQGWYNVTDSENPKYINCNESYTLTPTAEMTVKPVFVKMEGAAQFGVDSETFYSLNKADQAAKNGSTKTIVLMNNGTLAAAEYTISSGNTLLIPCDSANTIYTTEPAKVKNEDGASIITPTAYRTLQMANGANITVNGAISVAGSQFAGGTGSVMGGVHGPVGFIRMADGSKITVNNGAKLYCWGYITGSGSVEVLSGGVVYESFQTTDWRGGTATSDIATNHPNRVFPMNQYYVQNVEVPMQLHAGAEEKGYSCTTISLVGIQGAEVPFVGANSLFTIDSGYLVKDYDETTDRQYYEIHGDVSMYRIRISMKLSLMGSVTLDSSEYVLPITSNLTVDVVSGNINITEDLAFLPGSEIYIRQGAKGNLSNGKSVFVYDSEDWGGYSGYLNHTYIPLHYAPGRDSNFTRTEPGDAKVVVDGTINADAGFLYTTEHGALVVSTGTGVVNMKKGTATETYQLTQGGSEGKDTYPAEIPVVVAKLQNEDGTTTDSSQISEYGTTYTYTNGVWVPKCNMNGTESGCVYNADAPTCATAKFCTICGNVAQAATENHTPDRDNPTCTEDKKCTSADCDYVFVSATGHKYTDSVTDPTCAVQGYTKHTCTACGDSYVDSYTNTLPHISSGTTVIQNTVPATCTTDGNHDVVDVCTVCGGDYSRVTVLDPATGHSWGDYKVTKDPTCAAEGAEERQCGICNATESRKIEKITTHTSNNAVVDCTTAETCMVCHIDITPAWGHTPSEAVKENEQEDGYYESVLYCKVCGTEMVRTNMSPDGKNHTGIVHVDEKAATCEEDGHSSYAECIDSGCPVCMEDGEQYKTEITVYPALGHTLQGVTVTYTWNNDYTECTAAGNCFRCGEEYSVTTANIVKTVVDVTCEADGYTTYTAIFAEETKVAAKTTEWLDVVTKTGHNYGDISYVWSEDNKSCAASQVCANDAEHVRTAVVEASVVVANPTCTEQGYTTYTAVFTQNWVEEKEQVKTEDYVDATGHSWKITSIAWGENLIKMTCTVNLECAHNAQHTQTGITAEQITESTVSATCTADGYTTFTATFAQEWGLEAQINTVTLEAKGHRWNFTVINYVWSEDYHTCTATRSCPTCSYTETETAVACFYNNTATCTEVGELTSTVQFENSAFGTGGEYSITVSSEALGHDMTLVEYTAPTCQTAGNKEYYSCARCNGLFVDSEGEIVTNANAQLLGTVDHVFTTYTYNNNVTCVEDGTKTASCDFGCGATDTVVDPEHTKLGHEYDAGVVSTAATCNDAGEMLYTCTREICTAETELHSYTVVIDALGHAYESVVTEPTCTTEGYTTHTCTRCDENTENHVVVNSKVAALGHKDEDKNHACDNGCDVYQGEHIDSNKNHKCDHGCAVEDFAVHEDSSTDEDHLCDYCEEQIGGHEYVDGVCNCGYVKDLNVSLTIKAEGADDLVEAHTVKYGSEFVKKMTFSSTCIGMQSITVKVGGEVISGEGYSYNLFTNELTIEKEYVTDDITIVLTAVQRHAVGGTENAYTAPTCTEEGKIVTTVHCADCGKPVSEFVTTIPAAGHAYTSAYTAPTFQLDAYTTYTCGKCGDSYNEIHKGTKLTVVATIGHAKFESLEEALAIAEAGDIIVLQTSVVVEGDAEWNLDGITLRIANIENNYGLVVRGNLTINGGTFKAAGLYGIGVTASGSLTINGGSFTTAGDNDYLIGSYGITIINDGTFAGQYNCVNGFDKGTVTINGGSFTTDAFDYSGDYESEDVMGNVSVKGGTYSKYPAAYLAEGYCYITSEGYYVVGKHEAGEPVIENEVASTCTEAGSYDSVTYCTYCGEEYSRTTESVIPTGHDYSEVVTPPTCTEQGYTTYSCATCGYSYPANYKDALNHNMTAIAAVDPTCTAPGNNAYYTCGRCYGVFEDEAGETATTAESEMLPATGHNYDAVVTDPTCTEQGYTVHTCQNGCGRNYTDSYVNALGHSYDEGAITTNPTCTGTGVKVFTCAVCSHTKAEDVAALGHTVVTDAYQAATCNESGWTEGKHCSICDFVLVPQTEIPAKNHANTVVTQAAKAATCTAAGLTEGKYCSACGEVFAEQTEIPARGHTAGEAVTENVVAPTCTVDGSHDEVVCCTVCEDEISRETVTDVATAHNYSEAVTAPTCTTQGYTVHTCQNGCGSVYTDSYVDALGHTEITLEAVAATCTETGMTEGKKCSTCGVVTVSQTVVAKLAHALVSTSFTAATCTTDGISVMTCSVCGHEETQILAATGHNPVDVEAKAPTCTAAGLTAGVKCSVCGEFTTAQEEIAPLGHSWDEGAVTAEPTCTEVGKKAFNCTVCGDDKTESIAALGHIEVADSAKAPTCTEVGLTEGKHCSVCGDTLVAQSEIQMVPHTEVIKLAKAPTCTATGLTEGKECSACGVTLLAQEEIPATGHTEVTIPAVDPACDKVGSTKGTRCSTCGEMLIAPEEIPTLEHEWDDGRVTTLPTCTETGVRTFTCSSCNGTKAEVEPALGHDVIYHPAQKPTHTSTGWEAYETCARCDEYNTMVPIPALGEAGITTFDEFLENLAILENMADTYVKKVSPGKDPLMLIIKYIRTGVDRYNSGSWNIMAGYEDTDFAKYVAEQEDAYNRALSEGEELMKVTGLKNIYEFYLPNGDFADIGHVFGSMDITYTNKTSEDHADVSGWAGDTVDLMSMVDQFGWESTDLEGMIEEINEKYFLKYREDFEEEPIEGTFSNTDIEGDLDAFYVMQQLYRSEYENGTLTDIFSNYMTPELTGKYRASFFLENRLDGVTLRSDVREAVYNEFVANGVVATLEGTRPFQTTDLTDLRKACCYVVADYLCRLGGDYVEIQDNEYFSVFQSTSSILAPGISQKINYATTADGKTMVFYLAVADVSREDVHVFANYNNNDPAAGWEMSRVIDQANAAQQKYGNPDSDYYIENYNVIASINGAGYDMSTGEPSGVLVMNGVEYHPVGASGFFGILDDGTAMIGTMAQYLALQAEGRVMEAIATFGDLIHDGKIVATDASDRASRTAVGITATGKVVFMVLDGRQGDLSCGGDMLEIAQIMLEAGCVEAVNLDGGGSSTYVAREEGATELSVVSKPSDGISRSVSTSLMMVSTAPSSTTFDHVVIDGEYAYFTTGSFGQFEAVAVSATGNVVEMPDGIEWVVSDASIGSITEDGIFTAVANGTVEIQMILDGVVVGTKKIYVVTPDNVYFEKSAINAIFGEEVWLPVKAVYEGKVVAINESDVALSLGNPAAGTIDGFVFIGDESCGLKTVKVYAALTEDKSITAMMELILYTKDEASFDFENATGGDRQLSWDREVSNATEGSANIYRAEDTQQDMVTTYTFAIDMSQIEMPSQLADLTYMLPGADVEGNNSAWNFLLQLAERVSTLTEVSPVLYFDKNLELDYSEMTVANEFFKLKDVIYNEQENSLTLILKWQRQDKPVDEATANPLCILSGIKLTPKDDAAWNNNSALSIVNTGTIGYDIYLRANALYSFSSKPENQEIYGIYPFTNVRDDGVQENGGHFRSIYKEFQDNYTLINSVKDGWVMEDGGFAYYENGERYTGICEINGYYYDFGENGVNIGQKKYSGDMTDAEGNEYYLVDGVKQTGWLVLDMKNVRYFNPETGIREELTAEEVPSTCIVDGHCLYISESGEQKLIEYDDAAGHEYVQQTNGAYVCSTCGWVRIEMPDVNVMLSTYVYTYNGEAKTPATTATAKDGRVLTKPGQSDYPDYYSTYNNNVNVGSATVTLTARKYGVFVNKTEWRGNAAESITVTYEIRPDLPTNMQVTAEENGVRISWTAAKAPGVTYVIYHSVDGKNWAEILTTTETSCVIESEAYKAGMFRMGSRKEVDGKTYESVSYTTPFSGNLYVYTGNRADDGKPTLMWTAVDGATSYVVYRSTSENGAYAKVFTTTGTTYTHVSAVEGNTYYYKVKVILNDGSELFSEVVANTCKLPEIPEEPEFKFVITPGNRADDGKPTLRWEKVDGANSYEVYRSTTIDGTFQKVFTTTGTTYTHASATLGNTYYYKVKVILNDGSELFSEVVTNTYKLPEVPEEPETPEEPEFKFVITPGNRADDGKPTLRWEKVDGANSYEVYRSTTIDGTFQKVFTTTGTTYTHVSATAGRTYYYKVKVILNDGTELFSEVVTNSMLAE